MHDVTISWNLSLFLSLSLSISLSPPSLSLLQDDGLMVLCGVCNVWQHAICFGLLQEEDVPEFHVCEQCAQSADDKSQGSQSVGGGDGGYKCTDPFLQFLSPVALQVCAN